VKIDGPMLVDDETESEVLLNVEVGESEKNDAISSVLTYNENSLTFSSKI